jgi:hypothetical protein
MKIARHWERRIWQHPERSIESITIVHDGHVNPRSSFATTAVFQSAQKAGSVAMSKISLQI